MRRLGLIATLVFAFVVRGDVTAIVGVNVLPMDTERVLAGQTVIVRDGVIAEIGPVANVVVPQEARVIYGRGRWLVPGLADMHVHIRAGDLPRYLENGITTVRDLAGIDSVLEVARQVESGERLGPRILASSRLLAGPNTVNAQFADVITSAAAADAVVAAQLARGCHSIKVYEELTPDVWDALIAAAHARGVKVSGHVSRHVPVTHAMTTLDSIEHLAGYEGALGAWQSANRALMPDLAAAARDAGVWNCPTLVVYTNWVTVGMPVARRTAILMNRRAFVEELHAAGARILAGSDSGYLIPAGTSLHDELEELIDAGLTPFEALSAATRSAGEYLEEQSGTIAVGARADLVLVAGNPLERISALRRPSGVMLGGRWISYERRRAVRSSVSVYPDERMRGGISKRSAR